LAPCPARWKREAAAQSGLCVLPPPWNPPSSLSGLDEVALLELEVVEGDCREGMSDAAGGDEVGQLRHRHQPGRDILAMIQLEGVAQATPFDQDRVAAVGHKSRVGGDGPNDARAFALIAGFFAQFADAGGDRRRVLGVHHPAWDLEFDAVSPMPELLDQDRLAVVGEGDDIDPIRAVEDIEVMGLPRARRDPTLFPGAEDAEVAEHGGLDCGPGFDHWERLGRGLGNFNHECVETAHVGVGRRVWNHGSH